MFISLLCRYYDIMEERGDVLREGYSVIPMNYLVCLTPEGGVDGIIDCGETREKRTVYPDMELPERSQKSCIDANIAEHRPLYLFGLAADKGAYDSANDKARKSHAAFVAATTDFFRDIDSPLAQAFYNFAQNWRAEAECENIFLKNIVKNYGTSRFAFCLTGEPGKKLHEDNAVRAKWEREYARKKAEAAGSRKSAPCSVLGEILPVAVLHDKIKGIRDGQPSGCVMVCVNNDSENSYGKTKANNSSMSEKAMKKYTAALNYLLGQNGENHRTYIDGLTIVHFALVKDETEMLDYVNYNIFDGDGENMIGGSDVDKGLDAAVGKIRSGDKPNFSSEAWDGAEYCLAGLVPNSSRVAVKFCYRNTFGSLRKNIEKYHADFAVGDADKAPPLWKIKKELLSPKAASAKLPPDIGSKLLGAMLENTPFPVSILQMIVRRICTDSDPENNHYVRMNDTRIGLLKACLIRINTNKEEIPTMSLNKENKNAAYLCGRMFAVLEKVQQDASSGKLNKTIPDTYFSAACATPATVFPRLFKLSQSHLSKLGDGAANYYNKLLEELADNLEIFPKTLAPEEQGNFILGYYQQKRALYQNNKQEED